MEPIWQSMDVLAGVEIGVSTAHQASKRYDLVVDQERGGDGGGGMIQARGEHQRAHHVGVLGCVTFTEDAVDLGAGELQS